MNIRKVGVVGCGLMGSGIAEAAARGGYDVLVREVSDDILAAGLRRVEDSMNRSVARQKLTAEEAARARGRVRGTTTLAEFADRDLVIEAAVEKMDAKKAIWRDLDGICGSATLFASNTSSLSITEMASVTGRPAAFCGLHFFNPVPMMSLVELVRGYLTSDETAAACTAFATSLGKRVVITKDYPGFIVNLLMIPYLLDAVRALEKGVASKEDIDAGITLGLNHPMGPLTLIDFIGVDTTYYIAEALYEEFREDKYAAPPLLKQMTLAGHHGRKSGRGFYAYDKKS
ncbi:MAG: 3-hydroxybutyryl-CoA dehydrogenase [Armatimonadetes bacterium]|nr:3-hydroxybutyryl-CoA dehydrogenase [Armatimonadota bacterium]